MREATGRNVPSPDIWMRYALFSLLTATGVILLYYGTVREMVAIWNRSETFTHGFLITPISLWLVWEKRAALVRLHPQHDLRVLALSLPMGLGWLLGNMVDVLVVQQFAFVGMLIAILWALLGNRVAKLLSFPLGFLLFSVPVGEGLIPPMMEFTTDFTVRMLQITGIPVHQEGTFFSIPSGNWSVVEGCSGVRYLIASITLGVFYAYLAYTRLWKRLIFITFAIVVPIFANGMRTYLIVMIAHLSDMRLALGVDHFIYGWVWFGIVITIMFLIGAAWSDPAESNPAQDSAGSANNGSRGIPFKALTACLLAAGIWPLLAWSMQQRIPENAGQVIIQAPTGVQGWHLSGSTHWDWMPRIMNPDGYLYRFYEKDSHTVALYLGMYLTQRQGAELVNSQNQMVRQKHPDWSNKGRFSAPMTLAGTDISVQQTKLVGRRHRLLTRHWYRLGSRHTANDYIAKLLEAVSRLLGLRKDAALIVVSTPYDVEMSEAEPVLQTFVDAMLSEIEHSLDQAAGQK